MIMWKTLSSHSPGNGAANVGPLEFTEEEYNVLTCLAQLEDKLKKESFIARSFLILQVLEKEVYESTAGKSG